MHKEHASQRELSNKDPDEEDEDEAECEDEDEDDEKMMTKFSMKRGLQSYEAHVLVVETTR